MGRRKRMPAAAGRSTGRSMRFGRRRKRMPAAAGRSTGRSMRFVGGGRGCPLQQEGALAVACGTTEEEEGQRACGTTEEEGQRQNRPEAKKKEHSRKLRRLY